MSNFQSVFNQQDRPTRDVTLSETVRKMVGRYAGVPLAHEGEPLPVDVVWGNAGLPGFVLISTEANFLWKMTPSEILGAVDDRASPKFFRGEPARVYDTLRKAHGLQDVSPFHVIFRWAGVGEMILHDGHAPNDADGVTLILRGRKRTLVLQHLQCYLRAELKMTGAYAEPDQPDAPEQP